MKKIVSVFLTIVMLLLSVTVFAAAENEQDAKVSIHFKSNLAGLTVSDCEKFVDLSGGNLVLVEDQTRVFDAASKSYTGEMKAGRTYRIGFEFAAADGYVVPYSLSAEDKEFITDEGVTVESSNFTDMFSKERPHHLHVFVYVTIPGNAFQYFFGRILDFILKVVYGKAI